jgi:ketosteroid isomerase-like protein
VRALLDQAGPVKVVLRTGKPEQTIGGRYVTTWKRQADGGWKIRSDVGVPGA